MDKLEQYGGRENIKILGLMERTDEKDNGEEVVTKTADALNVELNPEQNIQRVYRYRLGKKCSKAKPRSVIVHFHFM